MPWLTKTELNWYECACGWNTQVINDKRRMNTALRLHHKRCKVKTDNTDKTYFVGLVPNHLKGVGFTEMRHKTDQIKRLQ